MLCHIHVKIVYIVLAYIIVYVCVDMYIQNTIQKYTYTSQTLIRHPGKQDESKETPAS